MYKYNIYKVLHSKFYVPEVKTFFWRLKMLQSWGFDVENLFKLDSAWNKCFATVNLRRISKESSSFSPVKKDKQPIYQ